MKDKYWACILIIAIFLACVGGFSSYKHGLERGYNNKICEICEDNYGEGYNSYQQEYEEKINSCFEKCEVIHCFMIVGGCEDAHRICMWDCLHPKYGIAKIN